MEKNLYDFTYSQKSIWDEECFFNKSPLNNIAAYLVINEDVDFKKLRKALLKFIKNNDSFRIKLEKNGDTVYQYFEDFYDQDIELLKLKDVNAVENLCHTMVNIPFSFFGSFLFEFKMFEFPNKKGGFLLNAHHLIFDAWSSGIVIKQIMNDYQGIDNDVVSYSYVDHITSEETYIKSEKFEKDKKYWLEMFNSIPDPVSLPESIKNYNSNISSYSKRKDFVINKRLLKKINDYCSNNNISSYTFFMAVYSVYLARINNTTHFSLGTPILNRNNYKEKNTSGLFISTIPFCIDLDWKKTFNEFCKYIAVQSMSNFRHQKYPYKILLDDIRKKNSEISTLYNTFISYQNVRSTKSDTLDYFSKWISPSAIFNDLQIHIHDINDDNNLLVSYDFRIAKYTEKSIVDTHKRIINIINQILSSDSLVLSDIEVVTNEEKLALLSLNNTDKSYQTSKSIQYFIEKQVEKNPDKIAVVSNGKSLTYRELNEKANSLAFYLRKLGVKPNTFVGILQKRSLEMMVSLLAVLKSGAAYLPLDFNYPKDRISYMLENSETKIVLTSYELAYLVTDDSIQKVNVDFADNKLFNKHTNNLDDVNKSSDIAYIIYTSGSTGKPKGVKLKHRNINNFILGMSDKVAFSKNKNIVSVTTICFDIFVLESWLPLQKGLTIILANEDEQNDQILLNKLCLEYKVKMIQTTPSRMKKLTANIEYCSYFKYLTDILVGGESFPNTLLEYLKRLGHSNNTKIYNVYGPTETAVWSTVKDLSQTSVITVGKPISNTSCYILDQLTHSLLPKGIPGNLFIGGDGVCAGYHKRDDLNEKLFIKNKYKSREIIYDTNDLAKYSNNNEIIHLGRADFQVKVRGYRIEIGEIENKILEYPSIKETCVVAQDSRYLICYYVSTNDIIISELVSFLLEDLPNYMIPIYFVKMNKLPLTPNGKIDRKSLPKVNLDKNEKIVLASTDTEKLLEKYILNILNNGLENVDINTPFISLGLDSLSIVQLQSMLLGEKLNLTTQTFYKYPTIKQLAKYIDKSDTLAKETSFELLPDFMHDENEKIVNPKADELGNVFLTGSNGFIGAHILNELLETTNSKIYCLVRGATLDFSKERLYSSFKFYFNKNLESDYNGRVFVVNGDVSESNLAMSSEDLDLIKSNVSTIIHTAAIVKHYGNFDEFSKINISGTKNIADFAYKNNIRFVHISSISVSGNYLLKQQQKNVDFSENSLYIGQHYTENVYVNSKFESENFVYDFMKKGLRGKVLRVGILSGRTYDGIFQKNISSNAFYGRIKSFVTLGAVPQNLLTQKIEFTPVDECAKAIVLLAKTTELDNKIFHLYNHNLISLKDVVNSLTANGFNIKLLDDESFRNRVLNYSKSKNDAISAIVNDFNTTNLSLDYNFSVNIKSDFTIKALKSLGFEWQKIDKEYLSVIIKYMRDVHFL
ncbi:MAG: amino acid adenylation domain-containing protein [Clostridia bacterium]|nr:amino acid adenylation domain-containing protein [Clostridia bacterium]